MGYTWQFPTIETLALLLYVEYWWNSYFLDQGQQVVPPNSLILL